MDQVLRVEGLSVQYGMVPAVENIALTIGRGQIVSVIGPNGAGKSSTLNAIMGIQPSNATVQSKVWLNDAPLERLEVQERVQRGLSLVPEQRALFSTMTVQENLLLGAQLRAKDRSQDWLNQLDVVFELFPRLKERSSQLAGTMSGGERQMLALGRALMVKPQVLMLDEPSLGLAPLIVMEVLQAVSALTQSGVSVLLVEQNARAALKISDYAYVLENGRVSMQGGASDMLGDDRLVRAYLGC